MKGLAILVLLLVLYVVLIYLFAAPWDMDVVQKKDVRQARGEWERHYWVKIGGSWRELADGREWEKVRLGQKCYFSHIWGGLWGLDYCK